MAQNALAVALQNNDIRPMLQQALRDAHVYSVEALRKDEVMQRVVDVSLELMPGVVRVALLATIGQEGWRNLLFRLRDKLLELNTLDVFSLSREQIVALVLPRRDPGASFEAVLWGFFAVDREGRRASRPTIEIAGPAWRGGGPRYRPQLVIGRDEAGCDLVVPDRSVSRRHAELGFAAGAVLTIRDLGSSNGTVLDGAVVKAFAQPIAEGSDLHLGDVRLFVRVAR